MDPYQFPMMDQYIGSESFQRDKWNLVYAIHGRRTPWMQSEIPTDLLDRFITLVPPASRVLDYAAGNGRLANRIRPFRSTVAADLSFFALSAATDQSLLKVCTGTALCFRPKSFGGVICWGLLHHLRPESWAWWVSSLTIPLVQGGCLLIGMFDCSDIQFVNEESRRSPTTKMDTYCLRDNHAEMLISDDLEKIECETLILRDSGRENARTWRYVLARRRTP